MRDMTPAEKEALAWIEWWMRIHRDRGHLGGTLTESLAVMSRFLRKCGVKPKPLEMDGSGGVYAQRLDPAP